MKKRTMMIDMDEVITEKGFLYLINEYLKTNYKQEDFKNFRMQEIMPYEQRLEFFNWFKNYNMYDHCTLVPGVKEALKELKEYYDPIIGTAYIFPEAPEISGKIIKDKFDYLYNNFPFISPTNFIFINRKDLLHTYCKIDDGINNLRNAQKLLLFSAYHNREIPNEVINPLGIERVEGWTEITRKLLP